MIDVLFLPKRISHQEVCVVIDVLRATSTIVTALANGAKCVIPARTVAQAKRMKVENVLICGERGGVKPNGFDLGNSPTEYFGVRGKEIVLTTTNGTKAISMINAQVIYAACFLNLRQIVKHLSGHMHVTLICSGQDGKVAYEDALCAGAIVHELGRDELTDAAKMAKELWEIHEKGDLLGALLRAEHAQELIKYGFSEDVSFCAQKDLYDTVPIFSKDRFVAE